MVNIWKLKNSLKYLAGQKRKYEKSRDYGKISRIKAQQRVIKNRIMDLKKSRNMRKKDGIK